MKTVKFISIFFIIFAITGSFSLAQVSIFDSPITYVVSDSAYRVTTADLNADSSLDLIFTNDYNNQLAVLIGDGNGWFSIPDFYLSSLWHFPIAVEVGDLDGDDIPDIAAAGLLGLDIYYGEGDGTFGTLESKGQCNADDLVFDDFNNDSLLDVVTTSWSYEDTLWVHLNNGDSTFSKSFILLGIGTDDIVVADLDSNNSPDLIVACTNGSIYSLINHGSANFTPQLIYEDSCMSNFAYLVAADFNGDNAVDLAVTEDCNDSVRIFQNDGAGNFTSVHTYLVGAASTSIVAARFDADSTIDLIVADQNDNGLRIFLGNGNLSFNLDTVYQSGGKPTSMAVGDYDNDGYNDLAVTYMDSGKVAIYINQFDLALDIVDETVNGILPTEFYVAQNYPNPFNPSTTINFSLPVKSDISLKIYNILGQSVKTLLSQEISAGDYSIKWDGKDTNGNLVTTGVYFYQIKSDKFSETKRMLFLK